MFDRLDAPATLPADLLALVARHDCVSLDIFDTLLVRAGVNPADIFGIVAATSPAATSTRLSARQASA